MAGSCTGCAAEDLSPHTGVGGKAKLPGSAIAVLSPPTAAAGLVLQQPFLNVFAVNPLLKGKIFLLPL